MTCQCRCHLVAPGVPIECDVDTGSSGASIRSCSPCDGGEAAPRRTARPRRQASLDEQQVQVEIHADELAALWRALPYAVAKDSTGLLGDGHGGSGGSATGSPATVNLTVVDAAARIETGVLDLAAQAVRLLRLQTDAARSPMRIIEALPDWHLALANSRQPLAEHLRKDLKSWVRDARMALGMQRRDVRLGPLCPDHRDKHPTALLKVGAVAELAPSLLAGPPRARLHISRIGPACRDGSCTHVTCVVIRDSRVVDAAGSVTDWVFTADRGMVWSSLDGSPALRWKDSNAIRCPHCKLVWASIAERRILARRLAELGAPPDTARLIAQ